MTPDPAETFGAPVHGAAHFPADRKWAASNRAISAWVTARRHRFFEAISVAKSFQRRLKHLFPLLSEICRGTCPWCPEPCCIVTRVWYDFRDILFFHLTDVPLPPGPLTAEEKEACRYLTFRGCALPRIQRPWGCTQYLCPTQRGYLVKIKGRAALRDLEEILREIAASRIVMEESVTGAHEV